MLIVKKLWVLPSFLKTLTKIIQDFENTRVDLLTPLQHLLTYVLSDCFSVNYNPHTQIGLVA